MALSFSAFRHKYGISITDVPDPDDKNNPELDSVMQDLYYEAQESPRRAIPKLEDLLERYPNECAVYNFLFTAYALGGRGVKARRLLDRTIELFPDYLFGPVNLITINKDDKRTVLKKAHLLGANLSITDWPADSRGAYHISEFASFEKAVVTVFIQQENLLAAKERLRRLLELGIQEDDLGPLLDMYQKAMLELVEKRRENARTRQVKPACHCTLDYREDYLELEVEEGPLDDLWYCRFDNVEAPLLERMLALPEETIISAARRVLYIALTVFQATETKDFFEDDIGVHAEIAQHALFLLAILGADEVLPEVLDFARLGPDGCDLMFGDYAEECFVVVLVELGRKDPEPLKDYLYEPHHESFTRLYVVLALEQIAWHEPTLRGQIVRYFKAWLTTLLADEGNHPVLDTLVVTHVVWALVKLRADHLLPLLRKVSDRDWIEEDYAGDIERFAEEITRSPDPADRMPLPKTPEEYYTMTYRERRAKSAFPLLDEPDELDQLLMSRMTRGIRELLGDNLPIPSPFKAAEASAPKVIPTRTGKKIGRNDPCPCGSGRKYKKCCL